MSDFEMPYFLDGGGNKGYFKDSTARGQITDINSSLLPIDGVVKRFYINNRNTEIDTGINVSQQYSTGFVAIVSSHGSYNDGKMNLYIGGVAVRKQGETVGDLNVTRLGGVGLGTGTEGENATFSVVDDKLHIKSGEWQGATSITLILSKA